MMKNNNLEIFKVILGENNKIKLSFSNEVKSLIPIEKIEEALRDEVNEHLTPIMEKIINLLSEIE
ncbi:hypothetical protein [Clostridium butyricum]|uniref:hypothetical protein n=1 Tax=Clostridium butyricum TaxID=1492 RepID=UPI002AAFCABA|nr:hypothetical protein [Clostridium butyricum]